MRLNRRGRDAVVRRRGFLLSCVAMGGSSKFFIEAHCPGTKRVAQRELLKSCHFLAATSDARFEQLLAKSAERTKPEVSMLLKERNQNYENTHNMEPIQGDGGSAEPL